MTIKGPLRLRSCCWCFLSCSWRSSTCSNNGRAASSIDMASPPKTRRSEAVQQSQRGTEESPFIRWTLIAIALIFCLVFLLLPLLNVFVQAFSKGAAYYLNSLSNEDAWSSIRLTLVVATISVPLNVGFGLAAAWAIAKFEFRGKSLLITLIDLPFSVSPVISGLVYVLVFGGSGWLGPLLLRHGIQILFAVPGLVLATIFVTFPFIARELIPLMQAQGTEEEEAALTLGANG